VRVAACLWFGFTLPLAAQTLTGTVTNAATHEPVAGGSIALVVVKGGTPANARTDEHGAFRIQNVHPGDYLVLPMKAGFESPAAPARLHVEAGVDPAPVELAVMPWPSLGGRVLDPERQPVAGVTVSALPLRNNVELTAKSDSEGRYTFPSVASGEYLLLANPMELGGDKELAPTWYPHAPSRADGERIAVRAGAPLTGYDIILQGGPFFRIAGRVVEEGGRPAAGATVEFGTDYIAEAKAVADAEGRFEMAHVPALDGRVIARWKRGTTEWRGIVPLQVTHHDVNSLTAAVLAPVPLTGIVELDGARIDPSNSYVNLVRVDGVSSRIGGMANPQGFHFEEVYPGRYRLFFNPPPARHAYIDSVWLGDREITMQEFELTPGAPVVRVVLKTGGGRMQGSVEDGVGDGVLVLVPQEERLRYLPFLVDTFIAQNGHFQLADVRPGDYYALALRGTVHTTELQDPAVLAPLLPYAVSVHVEPPSTASVTLKAVTLPLP
jgi:hypothetical protein